MQFKHNKLFNKRRSGQRWINTFIADNGNWWLGGVDTGVKAQAKDGAKGDTGLGFVAILIKVLRIG